MGGQYLCGAAVDSAVDDDDDDDAAADDGGGGGAVDANKLHRP